MKTNPMFLHPEEMIGQEGSRSVSGRSSRGDADLYRSIGGEGDGNCDAGGQEDVDAHQEALQDAAFARSVFGGGGAATRQIQGPDDRIRVSDTTVWPWSTICALRMKFNGTFYVGTGCLIGPRLLLTCGHNVYDPSQGWADEVTIMPGHRRGTNPTPFGSVRVPGGPAKLRTVKGWKAGDSTFDIGAILLPANNPFGAAGALAVGNFHRDDLLAAPLVISGYPGDRSVHNAPYGDQWMHTRICSGVDHRTLVYLNDTTPGQSGSPIHVIRASDRKRFVVGVHTNGSTTSNSGTRINTEMFDQIQKWRQEAG